MVLLAGHGRAKYTTGTLLESSRDRRWSGLLAECWTHGEGELAEFLPRETEIAVMLEGRVHLRRRGDGRLQHSDAVPGMIWLCPAGVREDMIKAYGDIAEMIHIYLPAMLLSETALRELDVNPKVVRLHFDGGFRDPLIERIARAIHAELLDPAPAGKMLVETLGAALGIQILRRHSNLERAAISLPSVRGALDPRRLRRIAEFIDAHLSEDLTVETLANEACLSPFHFARAFKAATGTAPHRYLTDRRIEHAKSLIAEGRLPLVEIADVCGFSSQAHLTRWFKRIVGTTPGAYRATLG
ncbi:MAG: AraC family transcriptional regulator [Rhodospirillaceae bacterium]|nr:AraC family transcriptional regulator [Rhodospirillaceae bacterium]MCY4065205.1 AraC family transcriptional regulator [Rhodospirillaceae bacterium]